MNGPSAKARISSVLGKRLSFPSRVESLLSLNPVKSYYVDHTGSKNAVAVTTIAH